MTLIINAVWGPWAFHASDRFLSTVATQGKPALPWDPHSNKTVVVLGSDCWLVLGYTGMAFLDRKPTDQVIAEAISGHPDLSGSAMSGWFPGPGLHYREIRNRIESKVSAAYARLQDKPQNVSVLCSGVQRQRKSRRLKRVMFRIDVTPVNTSSSELVPRFMEWARFQGTATGTVHKDTIATMVERVKKYQEKGGDSPQIVREIMMDAVRATGKVLPHAVGKDAIGVYLDCIERKVSTRFHPADLAEQVAFLRSTSILDHMDARFGNVPAVSTPFVLKPGMIFGPAIGNAGGWTGSDGISFEYSGFGVPPPGGGGGFFAAQPRRRPP